MGLLGDAARPLRQSESFLELAGARPVASAIRRHGEAQLDACAETFEQLDGSVDMGRGLVKSPHIPEMAGALPRDVCLKPSVADRAGMTGSTCEQRVVVLVLPLECFKARLGRYRAQGGGGDQRLVDVPERRVALAVIVPEIARSMFCSARGRAASLVAVAASIKDKTIRR